MRIDAARVGADTVSAGGEGKLVGNWGEGGRGEGGGVSLLFWGGGFHFEGDRVWIGVVKAEGLGDLVSEGA